MFVSISTAKFVYVITDTNSMLNQYMCSMFALLCLHLFMYGCNLLTWKSARINYNFIFEFQPKTALKYRDAFLICTSLMTAVVGALIIHLILISQGFSPRQVDMIPGILLLVSNLHNCIQYDQRKRIKLILMYINMQYYVSNVPLSIFLRLYFSFSSGYSYVR